MSTPAKPRRKRASYSDLCLRGYVRHGRRIIRFLAVEFFGGRLESGPTRSFICRLRSNDPRPRGIYFKGEDWCADWHARLPIGQWRQIVSPAA